MQRHSILDPKMPSRRQFTACGGSAGLALTRCFVAWHGRAICVESTPGHACTLAFARALRALGVA
jgi:light-regulated signal transduction histidine kinase (bacteriophytochrome)